MEIKMNERLQQLQISATPLFPFALYEQNACFGRFVVPCHWHNEIEILFIFSGTTELILDGKFYELTKGDIVFINAQQLHQFHAMSDDARYYAYLFPMKGLSFQEADAAQIQVLEPLLKGELGFPAMLRPEEKTYPFVREKILKIIALQQNHDACYELRIKIALLEIISTLAVHGQFHTRAAFQKEGLCKKILLYIKEHYTEKLPVSEIAANVGLSPNYFSAFFSEHFKQNFSSFLIAFRVEQACILLQTTNLSVTEIAFAAGFDTPSYFIQKFKECTGITPGQYRKRN